MGTLGKHWNLNEETKIKMRLAHTGKSLSNVHKNNLSLAKIGKPLSEKHKQNISKSLLKVNTWMLGRKLSNETKLKMSLKRKGRTLTQEWKDKIRIGNKGKKFSIETIEKMKEARARQIIKHSKNTIEKMKLMRAKQIIPIKDTKIEIKIQNYLKQLGIQFFTHQYIKEIEHGYQCDIFIPFINLVIECDGDYWHKYPIGREIDRVRTSELINNGFKVIRLWEHEIETMGLDNFQRRLKLQE